MTTLLVGTFIFFGIHTLLWLPRSRSRRCATAGSCASRPSGEKQFRRFKRLPRYLHILVIISFLGLAVTGMTLKFSYLRLGAVAGPRRWAASRAAGTIHRMCAIITFFYFARHIYRPGLPQAGSRASRWREFLFGPDGMMPEQARRARSSVSTLKWFVGLGARPQYGRWTYWEKFDYFAVFWGVAMIGFSGPDPVVPRVLHPRACRAGSSTWRPSSTRTRRCWPPASSSPIHFFNTHFRPDRFPMDPVIFTGRMSLEEFKEDRPREYERAGRARAELEKHLVDPLSPKHGQGAQDLRVHGADDRAGADRADHLDGDVQVQVGRGT